jgi:hypothetical protein
MTMDLIERVARAIGEAALNDDPGRTQLDWPDISYPDANGGLNLLVLAQAAINEITTAREFSERLRYYAKWVDEVYGDLPTDKAPGPPRALVKQMLDEADSLAAAGQSPSK